MRKMMRELTEKDVKAVEKTICDVMTRFFPEWTYGLAAPFLFEVEVPIWEGKEAAVKAFNKLFHEIGILPKNETISMGVGRDYCAICDGEDGESYCAKFNHPMAMQFKKYDEEYQYTLRSIFDEQAKAVLAEEIEMRRLLAGIENGQLKSKSPNCDLVLKGESYDAIEVGKKRIDYHDFTEHNLKRTIGIKTIRFVRGYAKNAPQMQWKVQKVTLMDYHGNECDPFNMPKDFWPTTIAIHLGKRIG